MDNFSLLFFLQSQTQQDKALNPQEIEEIQCGFQLHLLVNVCQYKHLCVHHDE